jgi:Trm5-related predicted tRNA methylase
MLKIPEGARMETAIIIVTAMRGAVRRVTC